MHDGRDVSDAEKNSAWHEQERRPRVVRRRRLEPSDDVRVLGDEGSGTSAGARRIVHAGGEPGRAGQGVSRASGPRAGGPRSGGGTSRVERGSGRSGGRSSRANEGDGARKSEGGSERADQGLATEAPVEIERPRRGRSGRRMYERSDVPRPGQHANQIAAVVLVVVAVAVVLLVTNLWRMANENSKLGDGDLTSAITSAATGSTADAVAARAQAAGLAPTGSQLEVVVFAVVDDDDQTTLAATYLAVLNDTTSAASLVGLPVDARVGDGGKTLAQGFSSKGASGLVAELGAATVPVSHVVVMTQSGWAEFLTVAQKGSSALKSGMSKLIEGIVSTDMDAQALLDVGTRAASAGVSSGDTIASVTAEDRTDEAGQPYRRIDPAQIGVAIGTLAPAA